MPSNTDSLYTIGDVSLSMMRKENDLKGELLGKNG